MGNTMHAHLFKRRQVGQREEVVIKLFYPDGTPCDMEAFENGGGGASGWNWRGGWAADTDYKVGDVVVYQIWVYRARENTPGTPTFDEQGVWEELFQIANQGITWGGNWDPTATYLPLTLVFHQNAAWISTGYREAGSPAPDVDPDNWWEKFPTGAVDPPPGPEAPSVKNGDGTAWAGRVTAIALDAPTQVTIETDEAAYPDIWGGSRYGHLVLAELDVDATRFTVSATKDSGTMYLGVGLVAVKDDGSLQYITEGGGGSNADGTVVSVTAIAGTNVGNGVLTAGRWIGAFVGNSGSAHTGGDCTVVISRQV